MFGCTDLLRAERSVAGVALGIVDRERKGVTEALAIVADGDGVVKNGATLG